MRVLVTRLQRRALLGMAGAGVVLALLDCGGNANQPNKSNGVTKITVATAASGLDSPIDATPDPMGTTIFFIATTNGEKAVFSVPAAGGQVTALYSGSPLIDPRGISTSSDGKTLYIADPAAGSDGKGGILSMPSSGDIPVVVKGSEGTRPNALDVMQMGMSDEIYFTGADSMGEPAVHKLAAGGGTAETILAGAPLLKPGGIAVATDGTLYVTDSQAGMGEPGRLFKVTNGKVASLGPDLTPGDPPGVVVTLDDAKVLVSSLSMMSTSEVTIINSTSGTATTFNDVIGSNTVSGGIHRARYKDSYAWAGRTQVYSIRIHTVLADSSTPGGVADRSL